MAAAKDASDAAAGGDLYGRNLRECDGQFFYLAERVDRIVLTYAGEPFREIKGEPYDKGVEQKIRP